MSNETVAPGTHLGPMSEQARTDSLRRYRRLFVLSGPSGVGKNTIAGRLCEEKVAVRAITATTRRRRQGEKEGVDYSFLSEQEFESWINEGRMLEYARYCGNWYGTPASSVERALARGKPVLLVIDVEGGRQIKEKSPQATLIFIAPPSEEQLRRRLTTRGREDAKGIEQRVRRAREEMAAATNYDYVVVNDSLEEAVNEVRQIIEAHCA